VAWYYFSAILYVTPQSSSMAVIFSSRDAHLLNLNITFVNNSAGESGNSIYANPIYVCGYLPEASVQHTMFLDNEKEVYDAIFEIESTVGNGLQEISSIPNKITICNQTAAYK